MVLFPPFRPIRLRLFPGQISAADEEHDASAMRATFTLYSKQVRGTLGGLAKIAPVAALCCCAAFIVVKTRQPG